MDRAQRDPVDDGRGPARIDVIDDVGCLKKRRLTQSAHGALRRVCAQDGRAEAVLVQTNDRFAGGVPADILIRHGSSLRRVRGRQPGFELDESSLSVHGHDERRRDDRVLTRRNPAEVDQRHREIVRSE